jgi:hypothetical protein
MRGYRGRLYWYNFLPFHFIIFKDLLKQLVIRSYKRIFMSGEDHSGEGYSEKHHSGAG